MSTTPPTLDPALVYCEICDSMRPAEGAEERTAGLARYHVCAACLDTEPCDDCDGAHRRGAPCAEAPAT